MIQAEKETANQKGPGPICPAHDNIRVNHGKMSSWV